MKFYKAYTDNLIFYDRFLQAKTLLVFFSLSLIFSVYDLFSPTLTFILLDSILAIYLTSLFRGKYKYLFLIHPIFLLLSSYGFEVPFADIGVGRTYITTFSILVEPDLHGLSSIYEYCAIMDSIFGFCLVYWGILPIIWLPNFLYGHSSEMTLYYSMGLFNMLYVAIAVYVSQFFRILNKKTLLILYFLQQFRQHFSRLIVHYTDMDFFFLAFFYFYCLILV